MNVVNPATGEVVHSFDAATWSEVDLRVGALQEGFDRWRRTPVAERARLLGAISPILRRRSRDLAEMMAREMGKPVAQGRQEIEKCAWLCDHYASAGPAMLAPQPVETDAHRSWVSFQPLGVVLAVMPWNFPFWQVFRAAVPALLAGNTMMLKHASNVPSSALAIEELFGEAGIPPGTFATALAEADLVPRIIAHPGIAAVTLTGSVSAGRAVARVAGENLKKTVLELGGSDAYLVLADADVEAAAELCTKSRLINAGQSCIAAKRFVVDASICARFEMAMVGRMRAVVMGDPMREETEVGPLAREDLRDELHRQVMDSVARGARLLLGGEVPRQPGAWYPPTVLTGVRPGMPAYDEEMFGPVAAVIPASGEKEAIRIANDSRFGLGAAVITADRERGAAIAELELDAGSCFVNSLVKSDPRLPFGGVRDSGYGRELGEFGIREFVNIKTVWVE
ncbi:MAG TPA: NAD-dependent succinate-semialdehyde dehydrogenase [Kofleriaceae bacterium]|nr:NAD-dependent succinate-semialdehyde dehydrogenase [Kofleriaceae bacterium]